MAEITSSQPTAADMVKRSLRLIGKLAPGEEPTTAEMNDGLIQLNELLESWNLERVMIYEQSREVLTLTSNKNPHTIGKSVDRSGNGDLNIPRPVNIRAASVVQTLGDQEIPISVISRKEYQQIITKSARSTYPTRLWYEREFPLGKIWLYPLPSAAVNLVLYIWKPLDSGLVSTDRLALPPGYARAVRYNLAIDLAAGDYAVDLTNQTIKIANDAKAAIASNNITEPAYVSLDQSVPGLRGIGRGQYNIRTGDYE